MPEKKTKGLKNQKTKEPKVNPDQDTGQDTPLRQGYEGQAAEKDKIIDEKELLREAEERELERKEAEEAEKEEEKKNAIKEKKASKIAGKISVRRKPRHGKKYRAVLEKLEKSKEYTIDEAIELIEVISTTKFKSTIELHVRLSKKLENVRGTFTLPGGAVKQKKVLEVTDKNVDELIAEVKSGKIDFDIIVAEPKVMPKIAQLAKILGPKGLMPNPKSGTVSEDVKAAAEDFRGGRVEYKADKSNIVHMAIAKVGEDSEKTKQNIEALLSQFPTPRIETIFLSTTMGPSIQIHI